MLTLPNPLKLIQRAKALASLDLIISPEWDYRYYSFNAHWSADEQMASMRNGSGDEWWIVFHKTGWAALKGLDHESTAWSKSGKKLSMALCAAIPNQLSTFANEPAFRWSDTSFAYFYLSESIGWKRANDLINIENFNTGEETLLNLLIGGPNDYVSFAEEYYEKTISTDIVSSVYNLRKITDDIVSSLNPEIKLENISSELFDEIDYPRLIS